MDLHYKQEVTVGALVLVGVALFVAGAMWLGGRGLSAAPTVQILFSDAGTLKRGSPVKVSGVTLGSVADIDFREFGKVLVKVTLDRRVQARSDASARLTAVGLVADAIINFNPGSAPDPLPGDKVVVGTVDPGFLALGGDLGERAKTLMTGVSDIANKKLADDLHQTMSAVQRMANLYSNPDKGPSAELTRTLSEVQRMGHRLDSLLDEAKPAAAVHRADSLGAELTRLSADARGTAAPLDPAPRRPARSPPASRPTRAGRRPGWTPCSPG